jgi:hypothetical protein
MAINNPQVQIAKKVETGQSDKHFLYVTTHFERTDYEPDGNEALPEVVDGVLTVTLKVKKAGEALRFNKAVTHQISLAGVDLGSIDEFLVLVKENTSIIASTTIVYQDETETVVKPITM